MYAIISDPDDDPNQMIGLQIEWELSKQAQSLHKLSKEEDDCEQSVSTTVSAAYPKGTCHREAA